MALSRLLVFLMPLDCGLFCLRLLCCRKLAPDRGLRLAVFITMLKDTSGFSIANGV